MGNFYYEFPLFALIGDKFLHLDEILIFLNLFLWVVFIVLFVQFMRKNKKNQEIFSQIRKQQELLGHEHQDLRGEIMRTQALVKEEVSFLRQESAQASRQMREEVRKGQREQLDSILGRMLEISGVQNAQMETFSTRIQQMNDTAENRMDTLGQIIEKQLDSIEKSNQKELQEMRLLVNEKLQASLEQRLGESFHLVNQQLEKVHQGLGEMQALAVGVGDLKKVLTNVKNRGIWGEMQLGNLLKDILTPEQYAVHVAVCPDNDEQVEYAVKLPGKQDGGETVWLPLQSVFPEKSYLRLMEALEQGDRTAAEEAGWDMEKEIKNEAENMKEKHLRPPYTTDFAILFVPTESLYAEVVRRTGLLHELQNHYRVNIAGPATMAAMLNSFAVGFRTLIMEKHSDEIWRTLGMVKTEFQNFGMLLDAARQKLEEASSNIDQVSGQTRSIERKLKDVHKIPLTGKVFPQEE